MNIQGDKAADVQGKLECLENLGLSYKHYPPEAFGAAFPMLNYPADFQGVTEIHAGILLADKCCEVLRVRYFY